MQPPHFICRRNNKFAPPHRRFSPPVCAVLRRTAPPPRLGRIRRWV